MTGLFTGRFDLAREGCRLLIYNVDLARRVGDPDSFWFAAGSRSIQAAAPQHTADLSAFAEELAQKSRAGVSARMHSFACAVPSHLFLVFGQRRRAEPFIKQMKEAAERSRQAVLLIYSMAMEGILATLDGDLEQAAAVGEAMRARGEQLGPAQFANILSMVVCSASLGYLGRLGEIIQIAKKIGSTDLMLQLEIGRDEEVAKILNLWVVDRPGIGSVEDETPAFIDIRLLRAAVRIGHRSSAELLLGRFAGCKMLTTGILGPTCVPRHLGAAAALWSRQAEARRYYDDAIKVTTEMPFRPELALARLQLAELPLEHYPAEKADALKHLDFAIKEFREMKMQPSLERSQKLHQVLSGSK